MHQTQKDKLKSKKLLKSKIDTRSGEDATFENKSKSFSNKRTSEQDNTDKNNQERHFRRDEAHQQGISTKSIDLSHQESHQLRDPAFS